MYIIKNILNRMLHRNTNFRIATDEVLDRAKHSSKQSGAVAAEYALVTALIVLILITAASAVDSPINTFLTEVVTKISAWVGD